MYNLPPIKNECFFIKRLKNRIRSLRSGALFWILPLCVATLVGCVLVSDAMARVSGRQAAQARAEDLAAGVLATVEDMTGQVARTIERVGSIEPSERCQPADLDLLHRVQASFNYVDGIARIDSNPKTVQCSTFGRQAQGLMQLGVPNYFTLSGSAVWRQAQLPWLKGEEFSILLKDQVAVFLHADAARGILSTLTDASLGAFSNKGGPIILSRGTYERQWLTKLLEEGRRSSFDGKHLVAIQSSATTDMVSFVVFPAARVETAVNHARKLFVPFGAAAGIACATGLFFLLNYFVSMPAALKRALGTDRVFMQYQPMVDLRTGKWIGAEALIRWKRGARMVPPDRFIAAAEKAGMIGALTRRVFALVSWDLADFLRANKEFHVSLNMSAEDLQSLRSVELIEGMLTLTGLPASSFWIEATETGFFAGGKGKEVVDRIRALGVKVAVDDFGTGYSSLSQLATLQVDVLKIDKSFVAAIAQEGPGRQVAAAIIALAKSLDLKLVAEGVETQQQADWLRQQGVDYAQGWLYAKPGEVSQLSARVSRVSRTTNLQETASS